jgi:uncharacterized coiled-coil DUF342 family protein
LKNKFDSTKKQVLAIVQNFGKIHSDLQELKQEYLEEQKSGGMSNNLVQISEAGLAMDGFLDDPKVLDLKAQLSQKNDEIQEMVQQFNSMHDQLTMINDELSEREEIDRKELVQLKNQEAETQLSKLFEQQSNEMR